MSNALEEVVNRREIALKVEAGARGMELGTIFHVSGSGEVVDTGGYRGEIIAVDRPVGDGSAITQQELVEAVLGEGMPWEWSFFGSFRGGLPMYHTSEFIGGPLAGDMAMLPGEYVAIAVDVREYCHKCDNPDCPMNEQEGTPAGWILLRRAV